MSHVFYFQDSLSSYDSFNKQANPPRIGPNAHDDLKTTLSKIDPTTSIQNSPSKYNPRWDQNSHRHGSKLDLKYGTNEQNMENSPRNSGELDKDCNQLESVSPRGSVERDMYRQIMYSSLNSKIFNNNVIRYARSPSKQNIPGKPQHVETKTDYSKYRQVFTSTPY